jgi:hypothetical protein
VRRVQAEGGHFEHVFQCEISSSHGGEYDVQSCLLGWQYNPEDSSEHQRVSIMNSLFSLLTSPHCTNRKYSERSALKLLQQGNRSTLYAGTNSFHFIKVNSHNNKSDINIETF